MDPYLRFRSRVSPSYIQTWTWNVLPQTWKVQHNESSLQFAAIHRCRHFEPCCYFRFLPHRSRIGSVLVRASMHWDLRVNGRSLLDLLADSSLLLFSKASLPQQ